MQQAVVRKLLSMGKARGFVTYDELNSVLPSDEFSPEAIDAAISALAQADINVVEEDAAAESSDDGDRVRGALGAPDAEGYVARRRRWRWDEV